MRRWPTPRGPSRGLTCEHPPAPGTVRQIKRTVASLGPPPPPPPGPPPPPPPPTLDVGFLLSAAGGAGGGGAVNEVRRLRRWRWRGRPDHRHRLAADGPLTRLSWARRGAAATFELQFGDGHAGAVTQHLQRPPRRRAAVSAEPPRAMAATAALAAAPDNGERDGWNGGHGARVLLAPGQAAVGATAGGGASGAGASQRARGLRGQQQHQRRLGVNYCFPGGGGGGVSPPIPAAAAAGRTASIASMPAAGQSGIAIISYPGPARRDWRNDHKRWQELLSTQPSQPRALSPSPKGGSLNAGRSSQ